MCLDVMLLHAYIEEVITVCKQTALLDVLLSGAFEGPVSATLYNI